MVEHGDVTLNRTAAAALVTALFLPTASPAQQKPPALEQLIACRKLPQDAERLACFDAAARGLEAAEAGGDIVVIDREQARQVRRQAFGFPLPSLALFGRGSAPEEDMDSVSLKVESASRSADGKWLLRLEGGQTWRQIDTAVLSRDPRTGGLVTIKRAMMGSYKLTTGSGGAIRVSRVQ
jgi:hypothetical protein